MYHVHTHTHTKKKIGVSLSYTSLTSVNVASLKNYALDVYFNNSNVGLPCHLMSSIRSIIISSLKCLNFNFLYFIYT